MDLKSAFHLTDNRSMANGAFKSLSMEQFPQAAQPFTATNCSQTHRLHLTHMDDWLNCKYFMQPRDWGREKIYSMFVCLTAISCFSCMDINITPANMSTVKGIATAAGYKVVTQQQIIYVNSLFMLSQQLKPQQSISPMHESWCLMVDQVIDEETAGCNLSQMVSGKLLSLPELQCGASNIQ